MTQLTLNDICEYDENMYENENQEECQEDKTYLGFVMTPDEKGVFLLDSRIHPNLFYRFNYNIVKEYGKLPIHPEHTLFGELEIVQVHIQDHRYTVVIKTFWLRLLQRRWKRYMKERNDWVQNIKKNIVKHVFRNGPLHGKPDCYRLL